jgi:hypothetical protein
MEGKAQGGGGAGRLSWWGGNARSMQGWQMPQSELAANSPPAAKTTAAPKPAAQHNCNLASNLPLPGGGPAPAAALPPWRRPAA